MCVFLLCRKGQEEAEELQFLLGANGVVKFLSEYRRTEFITKSTCMKTMYDSARGACESVCRWMHTSTVIRSALVVVRFVRGQ